MHGRNLPHIPKMKNDGVVIGVGERDGVVEAAVEALLDAREHRALRVLVLELRAGGVERAAHRRAVRDADGPAPRRVLGRQEDAEDVAQEAMLRLWRAASDWQSDGPARPATWLYRVTANLAIARLRRTGRAVGLDEVDEPEDPARSVESAMIQADRLSALDAALARLPERQRQAVVLRHIEGLSNPDVATALDISVEAVESLTARGRRKIAELLAGQKEALGYDD